jgi:hypothetical protein
MVEPPKTSTVSFCSFCISETAGLYGAHRLAVCCLTVRRSALLSAVPWR